jgi:hypothetical protein
MSNLEIKNKNGSVINYINCQDQKVYCEYCIFGYYHREDCCGEYDSDTIKESIKDDFRLIQTFKPKQKYSNTDDFNTFEFSEKPLCFYTFSMMVDNILSEHFHSSRYCRDLVTKISYFIDLKINRQLQNMNKEFVLLLISIIKKQIKQNGRNFKTSLLVAIYHKTNPERRYYVNNYGVTFEISLQDVIDLYYDKLIIDNTFLMDAYDYLDSPAVNKACDYILENY